MSIQLNNEREKLLDTIAEGQAVCRFLLNDAGLRDREFVEGALRFFTALYDEYSGARFNRQIMSEPSSAPSGKEKGDTPEATPHICGDPSTDPCPDCSAQTPSSPRTATLEEAEAWLREPLWTPPTSPPALPTELRERPQTNAPTQPASPPAEPTR